MFEPFPLGLSGGRRIDRHGVIEPHLTLALLLRPFLDPRDIAAHSASSRRLGSTENFSPQQSENFKTGVPAPSHYSIAGVGALAPVLTQSPPQSSYRSAFCPPYLRREFSQVPTSATVITS